jgi:hypothetical protein
MLLKTFDTAQQKDQLAEELLGQIRELSTAIWGRPVIQSVRSLSHAAGVCSSVQACLSC